MHIRLRKDVAELPLKFGRNLLRDSLRISSLRPPRPEVIQQGDTHRMGKSLHGALAEPGKMAGGVIFGQSLSRPPVLDRKSVV